jgi:hypothetical protein
MDKNSNNKTKVSNANNRSISKQIETYRDYLMMLKLGHVHSVLCYSSAGLGKTYTTIKILKDLNVKFKYINGVATAVELYKNLYENKDAFLIIDDVETLFQDDRIINLLKASLWEVDGRRIVSYRTSSSVLEGFPDEFEYTGKIIILANEIKGRYDESHKALFSRCLSYELVYSFNEVINMSKTIIDSDANLSVLQKAKIKGILFSRIRPEHNFNFRLLNRLTSFVKYNADKAEELFMESIETDEEIEIMNRLLNSNMSVTEQIDEYKTATGNSKATFFRRKQNMIRKKQICLKTAKNNDDSNDFISFNDIK